MMLRIVILTVFCVVLLVSGAGAQGVQNPLYLAKHEKCVPLAGGLVTEISAKGKANLTPRYLPPLELLVLLQTAYPIVAKSPEQFDLSQRDLLYLRLVPGRETVETLNKLYLNNNDYSCAKKGTKAVPLQDAAISCPESLDKNNKMITKGDPRLAEAVRFDGDKNALLFRRSLLRYFEAAYSGGANDFRVLKNSSVLSESKLMQEPFPDTATYRPFSSNQPASDDKMIAAFLETAFDNDLSNDVFQTLCLSEKNGSGNDASVIRLKSVAVSGQNVSQDDIDRSSTRATQDLFKFINRTGGGLTLVKDVSQFRESKPESAAVSFMFDLEETDDQSELAVDAALGFSLQLDKINLGLPSWSESKTVFVPFVAIDQYALNIKDLDPDFPIRPDGSENTVGRSIAFADITAGLRIDLSEEPKRVEDSGWVKHPHGQMSLTLAAITDNYLDQQGYQIEFAARPRFMNVLPAHRRPVRLGGDRMIRTDDKGQLTTLSSLLSGFFQWESEIILDQIEYARNPRNFETAADRGDRLSDSNVDVFRLGVDLGGKITWNNVFSPASDTARIELSGLYRFREGLETNDATSQNWMLGLKLKDIASERYSLGVKYEKGQSLLSQNDFEHYMVEFGIKLGVK